MCKKQKQDKLRRVHARQRAQQRCGVNLSQRLQDEWVKKIQAGEAEFVKKSSLRASVWDVPHDDKMVRVVYDRKRKLIMTVLPNDTSLNSW